MGKLKGSVGFDSPSQPVKTNAANMAMRRKSFLSVINT